MPVKAADVKSEMEYSKYILFIWYFSVGCLFYTCRYIYLQSTRYPPLVWATRTADYLTNFKKHESLI